MKEFVFFRFGLNTDASSVAIIFVRAKNENELIKETFKDPILFDLFYYPIIDRSYMTNENVWFLGFSKCLIEYPTEIDPSFFHENPKFKDSNPPCFLEFKKRLLKYSETLTFEKYIEEFACRDEVGLEFISTKEEIEKLISSRIWYFNDNYMCQKTLEDLRKFYDSILEEKVPENIKWRGFGSSHLDEYAFLFNIYDEMEELALGISTNQIKLKRELFDKNVLKIVKEFINESLF